MARWGQYLGHGEYVCIWPGCYQHSQGVDTHDEHVLFTHLQDEALAAMAGLRQADLEANANQRRRMMTDAEKDAMSAFFILAGYEVNDGDIGASDDDAVGGIVVHREGGGALPSEEVLAKWEAHKTASGLKFGPGPPLPAARVAVITDDATKKALLARWQFLQGQLVQHKTMGSPAAVVKAIQDRMDGVIAEAVAKQIALPGEKPAPENITAAAEEVKLGWYAAKDLVRMTKAERLQLLREVREKRKAMAIANRETSPVGAVRTTLPEGAGVTRWQTRPKTGDGQAKPRPKGKGNGKCHCGCGGDTGSLFVPGHDSKYKSLLLKVYKGVLASDAPEVARLMGSDHGPLIWQTDAMGKPIATNNATTPI